MKLELFCPESRRPGPQHHVIWLDDKEYRFAVVDEQDYHWAVQWRWSVKPDRHGNKFYAYRTETSRSRLPQKTSLYLHVEIMKRTGILAPPGFIMVDHRSGCEFDCRRHNLRWATPSMNRRNIKGALAFDLEEYAQGPA